MLMFAVVARERSRLFRFLLLPFLLCYVTGHANAASTASLNVKIRQLNPDSAIQQAICADGKQCQLTLPLVTAQGKKTDLTVSAFFVPNTMLLRFQTPDGYFYTRDKTVTDQHQDYETTLHKKVTPEKSATYDVTLYLPMASTPAPRTTDKVQSPAAELEITAGGRP